MRLSTLVGMFLFMVMTIAVAEPAVTVTKIVVDSELKAMCSFKGRVTSFTYEHRNYVSEGEMLQMLEHDWKLAREDTWPYAMYVDAQRIVREAHRRVQGEYREPCCTKAIVEERVSDELTSCVFNRF